jgi:hypothetical protein
MRAKRWAAAAAMSMVVTAATLAGTASGAFATPTNCTVTYGSNWAQSLCTGGTGQHRVHMLQQHFMPGVGPILCVGPWAAVGSVSYTPCGYHTIVNVWYTTQG